MYHLGIPGLVANETPAFALGVASQALDTIIEMAQTAGHGYGPPCSLAGRSSFQKAIGECDFGLRAARALVIDIFERAWQTVCDGNTPGPRSQAEMRGVGTFVTEVAVDVVTTAFRYGGGRSLYLSHILQQNLRDINAVAQHFMVSDSAYENHAQFLLGLPDANPMG